MAKMTSKALQINLERSRVDVTISAEYKVLQEVMSKYYGLMEGLNGEADIVADLRGNRVLRIGKGGADIDRPGKLAIGIARRPVLERGPAAGRPVADRTSESSVEPGEVHAPLDPKRPGERNQLVALSTRSRNAQRDIRQESDGSQ